VLWLFRDGVLWAKWPELIENQNGAQVASFAVRAFGKNGWLCCLWLIVLPYLLFGSKQLLAND